MLAIPRNNFWSYLKTQILNAFSSRSFSDMFLGVSLAWSQCTRTCSNGFGNGLMTTSIPWLWLIVIDSLFEHSRKAWLIKLVSWLLMQGLQASPGHQQLWDIIMGRMDICFTSVATLWWGEACCLLLCFPTGTSYCVALSAVLNFDYLGECSHWGNRGRVA